MTLGSPLLSAIPGLRHAFFSREGGVSEGIYAGLNGGLGSRDDPAKVAENRRRMAEQLGVPFDHLISVHQVHSPDVVVVDRPWNARRAPRRTRSSPVPRGSRYRSQQPTAARSCSSTPMRG